MNTATLFCYLSSASIAELISRAKHSICYAGPGIQAEPANAIIAAAQRLGFEMLTICIDFDENVMRMGYGEIASVKKIMDAGILISHSPGLRNALIIVDGEGYTYTPTALLLEPEHDSGKTHNALRLSHNQISEALARLSPAAKIIAVAQADDPAEKTRINAISVEIGATNVDNKLLSKVEHSLQEAPPVQFDIARQVRVFEAYFQYVELKLTGAAIQRRKLSLPPTIQQLGEDKDIENRLHTTFTLIANDSEFSSSDIDKKLRTIRDELTRSIGKGHGRIVLKSAKCRLIEELKGLREELKAHQKKVKDNLQQQITKSRDEVVQYYLPLIMKRIKDGAPPMGLVGVALSRPPSEKDALSWLTSEVDKVFPEADSLIIKMTLEEYYKDVTFETLKHDDFKSKVKQAYPNIDWDSVYKEFCAVGEAGY